jgi:hypothetical protein
MGGGGYGAGYGGGGAGGGAGYGGGGGGGGGYGQLPGMSDMGVDMRDMRGGASMPSMSMFPQQMWPPAAYGGHGGWGGMPGGEGDSALMGMPSLGGHSLGPLSSLGGGAGGIPWGVAGAPPGWQFAGFPMGPPMGASLAPPRQQQPMMMQHHHAPQPPQQPPPGGEQ